MSTTATASSPVGTYVITPSGLTSTNYAITHVNGTLTVTSAVLAITANDQTKAYGAVNPALTVSYSGFVNGDTPASLTTPPIVTTTATAASSVGDISDHRERRGQFECQLHDQLRERAR